MRKKWTLPGFVFILLIFAILIANNWLKKWAPIPASQWALSQAGVQHNADWQPVIRQFNGTDWALVPAGCFQMGSLDTQREQALAACKAFGGEKCPFVFDQPAATMCFQHTYWIGLTEVTNQQYGSSSSTNMDTMYRGPDWPRETVTWKEAAAFCASHSARLPTEAEWEYAARGPDSLLFPWGNEMSSQYLQQAIRLNPQDVDALDMDISWVGGRGMAGNVSEWTLDPALSETQFARGGSWASYTDFLLRATQRLPYGSEYRSSTVGFRCVREAQP